MGGAASPGLDPGRGMRLLDAWVYSEGERKPRRVPSHESRAYAASRAVKTLESSPQRAKDRRGAPNPMWVLASSVM